MPQTDFPKNSSTVIDGKIKYHMFSEIGNAEHARMKRPVVRHLDKIIHDFIGYLQERYVDTGKTCEFGDWLTYCESIILCCSPSRCNGFNLS
jgi:hypothetical protein